MLKIVGTRKIQNQPALNITYGHYKHNNITVSTYHDQYHGFTADMYDIVQSPWRPVRIETPVPLTLLVVVPTAAGMNTRIMDVLSTKFSTKLRSCDHAIKHHHHGSCDGYDVGHSSHPPSHSALDALPKGSSGLGITTSR